MCSGLETVYLWGYGYQYPIAETHGSSYDQVEQLLGTSPESLSSQVSPSTSILTKLRNYAEGLVTTYTWKPLNGMESLTKPNGDVTIFQYDSLRPARPSENQPPQRQCPVENGICLQRTVMDKEHQRAVVQRDAILQRPAP